MTDTHTRSGMSGGRFLNVSDAVLARAMRPDNPNGAEWEEAWNAFDALYAGAIMALIRRMAGKLGRDECDDLFGIAQERILRFVGRYDPRIGSLRSWSFRVAQRVALTRIRSGRRAALEDTFLSFEDVAEEVGLVQAEDQARELGDEVIGPVTYRAADGDIVRAALEQLTDRDQAVLELTVLTDRPHEEVAQAIGVPTSRVRQIRYKAIARLKKKFDALKAKSRAYRK